MHDTPVRDHRQVEPALICRDVRDGTQSEELSPFHRPPPKEVLPTHRRDAKSLGRPLFTGLTDHEGMILRKASSEFSKSSQLP